MMEPWNEQVDDEEEAGEEAEANVGEPPAHPRLEDGQLGEEKEKERSVKVQEKERSHLLASEQGCIKVD